MVFIYGAYGFTGRQLLSMLSNSDKIPLILSGRDEGKLMSLASKLKDKGIGNFELCVATPHELSDKKISGISLVVNTAGPFSEFGEYILRFSLMNGANYIDCSGEAFWTKKIYEKYSDEFRKKGLFVSSGVAWETVAGEKAVKGLISQMKKDRFQFQFQNSQPSFIFLVYLADFNMSSGTLKSSLHIIKDGALRWVKGQIVCISPATDLFRFKMGEKNFAATNISTSDLLNVPLSLGELGKNIIFDVLFASSLGRAMLFRSLVRILRPSLRFSFFLSLLKNILDKFPDPDESKDNRASAIAFLADERKNIYMTYSLCSSKPYRTTAKILSYFVEKFYDGKIKEKSGYLPPTELLDFPDEIFTD